MARLATSPKLLALLVVAVTMLVGASPAHANYSAAANGCGGWSAGARDAAGNTYIPCNGNVRILRADGTLLRDAGINEGVFTIAPSPDGSYLYALDGSTAKRFTRGNDGVYRRDGFVFQAPAHYARYGWRVC